MKILARAVLLYGLDMINHVQFNHIRQIWTERIRIVHPKGTMPAYVGKEANKKYEGMIKNALKIINP
jgi:hypothetical protein